MRGGKVDIKAHNPPSSPMMRTRQKWVASALGPSLQFGRHDRQVTGEPPTGQERDLRPSMIRYTVAELISLQESPLVDSSFIQSIPAWTKVRPLITSVLVLSVMCVMCGVCVCPHGSGSPQTRYTTVQPFFLPVVSDCVWGACEDRGIS